MQTGLPGLREYMVNLSRILLHQMKRLRLSGPNTKVLYDSGICFKQKKLALNALLLGLPGDEENHAQAILIAERTSQGRLQIG